MASVKLENLSKTWPGGVEAVRGLDLDVADGEFIVLVGPSGCGKSTTLRMVAGLEDATAGTVSIGDRVVNRIHPRDRDIAMVFQNYALYPHMTAYRNMAFALKMRKTPPAEIDRRVRDAARILGIERLLDRKPRALSGGERQRVALGRAIVRDPACFLFDEPLSNLDVKLRVQMRAELKALHLRLKTTTVYVTHDQEEAMTLGDRVAVMHEGRIHQVAPPLEIYRKPVNRFVAGFMGLPPMNFLDGRIERADRRACFARGDDLRIVLPDALAGAAEKAVDREIVLGIRPEALRIAPKSGGQGDRGAASASVSARAEVVEPLGDRKDVFASLADGARIIARVDALSPVEAGEAITLTFRPDDLHLFASGEAGAHLLYGAEAR